MWNLDFETFYPFVMVFLQLDHDTLLKVYPPRVLFSDQYSISATKAWTQY